MSLFPAGEMLRVDFTVLAETDGAVAERVTT